MSRRRRGFMNLYTADKHRSQRACNLGTVFPLNARTLS